MSDVKYKLISRNDQRVAEALNAAYPRPGKAVMARLIAWGGQGGQATKGGAFVLRDVLIGFGCGYGEDFFIRRIPMDAEHNWRHPTSEELDLLDEVMQSDAGFTGWECDFIKSVDSKREEEWSQRQREKLWSIAERIGVVDRRG